MSKIEAVRTDARKSVDQGKPVPPPAPSQPSVLREAQVAVWNEKRK